MKLNTLVKEHTLVVYLYPRIDFGNTTGMEVEQTIKSIP